MEAGARPIHAGDRNGGRLSMSRSLSQGVLIGHGIPRPRGWGRKPEDPTRVEPRLTLGAGRAYSEA